MTKLSMEERFWAKVNKTDGCWLWTADKGNGGYGRIRSNGRLLQAHRISFEWVYGPIPDGMVIDHICHTRGCVRPEHLRVATTKQNIEYRRGAQPNNKSSGVRGVYRNGNSWQAKVCHHGKMLSFGTYRTIAEAEQVAIRERARLFTFPEDMNGTFSRDIFAS